MKDAPKLQQKIDELTVVRRDSDFYKKGIRTGYYLIAADGIPISDYCTY